MLTRLLRALLPGVCLLCEEPLAGIELDLCRHCRDALPWNHRACVRCAEPLTGLPASPRHAGSPPLQMAAGTAAVCCSRCATRPPPFTRTLAPLQYRDFPRLWVQRLKDHAGMVEGHLLGALLADAAHACYEPGDQRPMALIPVPLAPGRLARRGHNQALCLARPVARRLGIPIWRRAVVRTAPGRHQRGLGRSERLHNPAGQFTCRHTWPDAPCLAVVDDVMTTGATAAEMARVLRQAGAGEVHVLCATRTPRRPKTA